MAGILGLNGAGKSLQALSCPFIQEPFVFTGTVLITEWINVEYFGNTEFDPPVLRFGKAFATLGVALGLVAIFQAGRLMYHHPAFGDLIEIPVVHPPQSRSQNLTKTNWCDALLTAQLPHASTGLCTRR